MLNSGRIHLNKAEERAVDELLAGHDGNATLTRRDPGERGPVVVHLGDDTWHITGAGKATKQKAGS